MLEYVLPGQIEKRSFEIIGEELASRGIVLDKAVESVTKRVIHTSADFDYAETMCYSPNAVETARELLRTGADIVTDTNMALAGINKKTLAKYGGEVHCFMADEDVAQEAKRRQITRAAVSMERAARLTRESGKRMIFAVGNAPTALIRLHEMMELYKTGGAVSTDNMQNTPEFSGFMPDFVIGVPVGFVNVEAAKELILDSDVPYIVNRGRKGGSNVAAAICNALLYELEKE